MKVLKFSPSVKKQLPPATTKKIQDFLLKVKPKTVPADCDMLSAFRTKNSRIVDLTALSSLNSRAAIQIDKFELQINSKTGKIISSENPSHWSWKKAFKKVEELIDNLQSNLDNPNIVEKTTVPFHK